MKNSRIVFYSILLVFMTTVTSFAYSAAAEANVVRLYKKAGFKGQIPQKEFDYWCKKFDNEQWDTSEILDDIRKKNGKAPSSNSQVKTGVLNKDSDKNVNSKDNKQTSSTLENKKRITIKKRSFTDSIMEAIKNERLGLKH